MSHDVSTDTMKHFETKLLELGELLSQRYDERSAIRTLKSATEGTAGKENGPFPRFFYDMRKGYYERFERVGHRLQSSFSVAQYANLHEAFVFMCKLLPPNDKKRFDDLLEDQSLTMEDLCAFCDVALIESDRKVNEVLKERSAVSYALAHKLSQAPLA